MSRTRLRGSARTSPTGASGVLALVVASGAWASGVTPLDAEEAARLALLHAPALEAQRAEVLREVEGAKRVEIDPLRLSFDHRAAEQVFGPRFDDNGDPYGPFDRTLVSVGLRPPPPSEWGFEQVAAGHKAAALGMDLESARRSIAAEVRLLHAHALLRRDALALVADAIAVGERMRDAVQARVVAEAATSLDASSAELELLDLQLEREELEAEQLRALARLGRLTATSGTVSVVGDPPACAPPGAADEILARARGRSPRLRGLQLRSAALDAEDVVATLRYLPWLREVSVGYLNQPVTDRDQLRAGVQVDVPIFAFFDGEGRDLELRRARNEAEVREAESELADDVVAAVERLRAAATLVDKHRAATEELTARSTTAVDAALRSGSADLVTVSSVYSRALRARRAHLRARERCVEATLELTVLTGDVVPADAN